MALPIAVRGKQELPVSGQQPTLADAAQTSPRQGYPFETLGFPPSNPHAHHYNRRRVFLKRQQSRKPQDTAPTAPPATQPRGWGSPWTLRRRRDSNEPWKEAENNNPESCVHLEDQRFALQF